MFKTLIKKLLKRKLIVSTIKASAVFLVDNTEITRHKNGDVSIRFRKEV